MCGFYRANAFRPEIRRNVSEESIVMIFCCLHLKPCSAFLFKNIKNVKSENSIKSFVEKFGRFLNVREREIIVI